MPDWRRYEPIPLSPILAHALEAFSEHGFHATSVRDIARRVGVTVPALYYYHANKQAILVALLEAATDDLRWRVQAAGEEFAAAGPRGRLAGVIQAIVLYMTHHYRLAALDTELRYLDPQTRRPYANSRRRVEALVTEILMDGTESGDFQVEEPSEASRALLGMCQSVAIWYREGGRLLPEELAERYSRLALRMVGTPVPIEHDPRLNAF